MSKQEVLIVTGGNPLEGEVEVSGGKNTAVALIPAALLADSPCTLENVPDIEDVHALVDILRALGAQVDYHEGTMVIDPRTVTGCEVSWVHAQRLRASYYLIGTLLGRFGEAKVASPGGCKIGTRPIDQHLKGFAALGAVTEAYGGAINAKAPNGLTGANVFFDMVTVGGTINVMLAAVRAKGKTSIHNAAKEPHIVDLANFLNSMGARIKGAGTDIIRIEGQEHLHGTTYTLIPDQIETGTLMIAAAATHGNVCVRGCIPTHMEALSAKLLEMGVHIREEGDMICVSHGSAYRYRAVNIKTQAYPGFPTDLQQPMSALLVTANGQSIVTETIFEQRFKHLEEMGRMGAHVNFLDRTAIIEGVPLLTGARVTTTDLRAGAALLIAGLMAQGVTHIYEPGYIDRGYDHIERKLTMLGANITREWTD